MSGYRLTPEAAAGIESIWEFIAAGSLNRADKVVTVVSGYRDLFELFAAQ